jgi:hypothetical protein
MADDYYWDSNTQMDKNLFYSAGFTLDTDEVAEEYQDSKPNNHADRCRIV